MKIDGIDIIVGDKILVEVAPSFWQRILICLKIKKPRSYGIYTVTQIGNAADKFALTRKGI